MTDAEYVFKRTSKEAARIARGVYAKKGGSRSKRCSLPSDNLTEKQRKELNGELKSWNLGEKHTYIEFLQMPKDIQLEYIKSLIDKYGARRKDVANMMGVDQNALGSYIWRNFEKSDLWGHKSRRTQTAEWRAFIGQSEALPGEVLEDVEEKNEAPAASESVKQAVPSADADELLKIISGTLNFEGDPAVVFNKALMTLDPSKRYKIQIRYQVYDY